MNVRQNLMPSVLVTVRKHTTKSPRELAKSKAEGPAKAAGGTWSRGHRWPLVSCLPSSSTHSTRNSGSGGVRSRRRDPCWVGPVPGQGRPGVGSGTDRCHIPRKRPPTSLPCPWLSPGATPSHSQRQSLRWAHTRALMVHSLWEERPFSHVLSVHRPSSHS